MSHIIKGKLRSYISNCYSWLDNDNVCDIIKYIDENKIDVRADDNYILIKAATRGKLDLVKHLVGLGVDIKVNNNRAIKEASSNGHLELVKYLVSLGADTDGSYFRGVTYDFCFGCCVELASKNGHLNTIEYLIRVGANINCAKLDDNIINQMFVNSKYELLHKLLENDDTYSGSKIKKMVARINDMLLVNSINKNKKFTDILFLTKK